MQMDRNMSGTVTPQEFKMQCAKMNMLLTDEEVRECFRLATKSEDAKFLNYPQVCKYDAGLRLRMARTQARAHATVCFRAEEGDARSHAVLTRACAAAVA